MSPRKAQWQNDYIAKTYDRINLTIPKGQKEILQKAATMNGESVNGMIWRLLQGELDRLKLSESKDSST